MTAIASRQDIQVEVERNFAAFQKLLGTIAPGHVGKFALLRSQGIVDYFDTAGDALKYGRVAYPDGLFSIQLVDRVVADLGFFSHAGTG